MKPECPALQADPLPSESPGKPLIEADPLTTTQEVAEELNTCLSTFYIWHLKQIGKVKKLDTWVPHELTTNKKNCHFEVSSLILHNNEPFLNRIVIQWKVDFIWQLATASSEAGPRRSSKHFPKPNLHQKEVMVTAWWSADSLTHYSFLNPSKTLTSETYFQQINEMHWKLQRLQPALVDRRAQFSTTAADCTMHSQRFKSWTNQAIKFCLIHYIHLTSCQTTTTFSSISTTFCRENTSTTSRKRKCFQRVPRIPKHKFLCYSNK